MMPALAGLLRRLTSALVLRGLLFVAIFSLAAVPPLDPDLWWHLANGRLILTTASIPHVDVYSFSAAGQPWVMHEWLADLGMYGLYQLGGLPLLVAIAGLAVTGAALCLYHLLRRTGLNPSAAVGLTLVGALAGSTAWGARPQLLNLLFTGVLLVGLARYRDRHLRAWMLPPFIWLWANLHSGFLVGVIISLLFVAGELAPVAQRSMSAAAFRWSPARPAGPGVALGAINLALLLAVGAGMLGYRALPNLQPANQAAAITAVLPVESTSVLERIGRPLRIFNYYDYGGYLVWRLYPGGGRVFIDGRVEVYGSRIFSEYLQVSYLAEGWPAVIARANPDAIVVPSAHPLVGLLQRGPGWRLIARDGGATVFTRVGFQP